MIISSIPKKGRIFALLFIALVLSGCDSMNSAESGGNQAPRIEEFVLDSQEARVDQYVGITAIVTDREGDELDFTWTTTNGNIGSDNNAVVWIPDEAAEATIRLIVNDGMATADRSMTMDVLPE